MPTVVAELPDKKTPVTREQVIETLWKAWQGFFGSTPKKESVWLLASQWALETGWGRSMHNFNLGNVKSRAGDGYDYQFYACNEILEKAEAERLHEADPEHAKISSTRSDGKCVIWFYPNHPGCRFRAFQTLLAGATDYISLLSRRFDKAWPAVDAGDPVEFSRLLRSQGYFTADLAGYTSQIASIFKTFSKVPFDYDSLPIMTVQEKAELDSVIALSMSDLAAGVIEDADTEPKGG